MIITKTILFFLLVGKASGSRGLALLEPFTVPLPVGVELVIVFGCRSLVELYCTVDVGRDCIEFWLWGGLI